MTSTLFRYKCRCGVSDFLRIEAGTAQCSVCAAAYPRSPGGVIDFIGETTKQNEYFDSVYQAGRSSKAEQLSRELGHPHDRRVAEAFLKNCGFPLDTPFHDLSILEVACGAGGFTAALLSHAGLHNCMLHAFDISCHGPELLARFERGVKSSNRLELSAQDARGMVFEDACFDIVVGRSVLHHFDDVEGFLRDCKRILKPGGVATFGEPFALGYGLGHACLKMAQAQLGTRYQGLEEAYKDIAHRIKIRGEQMAGLVDKHLFFQPTFISLARRAGFDSVDFVSVPPYNYYRDQFIDVLLVERGIADARLAQAAKALYSTIVDLFDAETFVHSIAAFIQVVLRT
jgi:ubiquinone/menaquinone biosynthesis C-methylase UbiE